ncbi:MAG: Lipid A biosynthesis lauroyltransferase [Elusimicrobia bacterium]|nr:Lipid A biosynthesis lauroyltransferase [Elusimicrobiota bacterium]
MGSFEKGDILKRLKHVAEFVLVKLLDGFFCSLPFPLAIQLGMGLGVFLSKIIPKRNALILSNLERAFPEMPENERHRTAWAVWKNLGRVAVEFLRLQEILKNSKKFPFIWEGVDQLDNFVKQKTGVILLAAHYCNWEVLGAAIAARFPEFTAIARPMRNPYVEEWVQKKRGLGGTRIILHRQAVKASLKWIKAHHMIGILIDQNLYTGGEFVSFFGRPAATTTLPALLHARTQAPVIITYVEREGAGFRARFTPPILPPPQITGENSIKAHTQAISDNIENIIRRYPENWFWVHNRWKRKKD